MFSSKIENYLGFPLGISGADLAERAREQALRFGAEILVAREGVRGEFSAGRRAGYLADGTKIIARCAICATGVQYRRLGLSNEGHFLGAGLYYGAGASEAALCGEDHVIVIGGGNSAGQAAMYFSRYARLVTVVIRGESLKDTLSTYLLDRIHAAPNIEVLTRTEVTALEPEVFPSCGQRIGVVSRRAVGRFGRQRTPRNERPNRVVDLRRTSRKRGADLPLAVPGLI